MSSNNLDQQEEEVCAIEAIYGEDCRVDRAQHLLEVYIPNHSSHPRVTVRVLLPDSYPSDGPPLLELDAPHIAPDVVTSIAHHLETMFSPGEVVLFNWIDWLREECSHWHNFNDLQQAGQGSSEDHDEGDDLAGLETAQEATERVTQMHAQYNAITQDAALMAAAAKTIVSAEPFTEKRSTFQAHVAPVTSAAQVEAVMAVLLQSNKIRNATHNIMAYRIHLPERNAFLQDSDDDGEAAAGGRLLHLLQVADARDVVVVVSRWFGGVLLGPARFTHINNAARMLLEQQGFIASRTKPQPGGGKKPTVKRK